MARRARPVRIAPVVAAAGFTLVLGRAIRRWLAVRIPTAIAAARASAGMAPAPVTSRARRRHALAEDED